MSRPSVRTPEMEAEIVERVASGISLREVARDPEMPPESTVRTWAAEDPAGFGARLRQAREASAAHWDDEAARVLIEAEGSKEEIARARELASHYRWRASKYAPRDYGDRLDVNVTGTVAIAEQLAEVRQRRAIIDVTPEPVPAALPAPIETEAEAAA